MAAKRVRTWWRSAAKRRAFAVVLAVSLAVLLIAALAGGALWMKTRADEASRQRGAAEAARIDTLVSLVASLQSRAAYASAAALAASEPRLPRSFKDNAELARYETATLLDASRLPAGPSLDVEWLQAATGTRPVLVSWGWSSGINTIEIGTRTEIANCGVMPGSPRIRLSPDGRWFSVHNAPTHETSLLPAPGCDKPDARLTEWSAYLAGQEGRGAHVVSTLPLPGPKLLLGWADGRVEMLRGMAAALPILRFDTAAIGLITNSAGNTYALLSRSGRLELVDGTGNALAAPLLLKRDALATTRDPAWIAFLRDADLPASHAMLFDQGAADGIAPAVLGILSKPESASVFLHDLAPDHPTVYDVAVSVPAGEGCPALALLGAHQLLSLPMDAACGKPAQQQPIAIALPGDWGSSTESERGMTSGAFCEGGSTMVLGTAHGELRWMRYVPAAAGGADRIDVEHRERGTWDDAVTALTCMEDGSVHAGFRNAGIKAYRPRLHLQQRVVGVRSARSYAEVFFEDQTWPVDTMHGSAKLEFFADSGDLRLTREGRSLWRRRPAEAKPPRPGLPSDEVTSVLADPLRSRVWVLTTMGRLSLLDLETGATLARFSTSFFAAVPNKEIALEKPQLDASGQLSFVFRYRDIAMRVAVEEGVR